MSVKEKPNGIVIIGYPVTGKTTVAEILKKNYIPNSQVIDKSKYLTYIPIKLGYDFSTSNDLSLDKFILSIKNFKGEISKEFVDSHLREITVKYSDLLRKHFTSSSGYNQKVVEAVRDKTKFPIIAGPRYFETIEYFANKGYAIYGLILKDEEERQKRTQDIAHNGVDWGHASKQLAIERKYFDLDQMLDFINKQKNKNKFNVFETSNISSEEIAKQIAINLGYQDGKLKRL